MAIVSGIYIKKSKEEPRSEIPSGQFLENHGLVGDMNSGEGDKQICLLRLEDRKIFELDERNGLCFKRFQESLQLSGLGEDDLKKGQKLRVGKALLEVSICGKRCWPECEIIQAKSLCHLSRTCRFLKVLESGIIEKGDTIHLI